MVIDGVDGGVTIGAGDGAGVGRMTGVVLDEPVGRIMPVPGFDFPGLVR
jgi:hypothetical protein